MKKIITFLALFCLMIASATALVSYSGQPQLPYIIYGHVNWNSQLLAGARLQITNQNTGFTETITSDSNGYWQEESGNWLTNDANRPPVMYGDTITVQATDGCGTADICQKSFTAFSGENKDFAVVNFDLTGTLSCPPVPQCSCSCSGGGGCSCGGGSSGTFYTADTCKTLFPNVCGVTSTTCPTPQTCPTQQTCPVCQPQQECPVVTPQECPKNECEGQSNGLLAIIAAIIAFLIGGGAVYVTLGKSNKVKVIKKDGKDVVQHQHPTISGYHSPDTVHKLSPHKKGELVPKYEKDAEGVWHYKE